MNVGGRSRTTWVKRVAVATSTLLVAASGGAIAATAAAGASQIHLVYSMWPGEQPGYAKDVALFEKAHPNISVTIEVIPYANYEPKLTEEFTTGGGPDVFWVNTPCRRGPKTVPSKTWRRSCRSRTSTCPPTTRTS